jgi:hypothetical protein
VREMMKLVEQRSIPNEKVIAVTLVSVDHVLTSRAQLHL